eukprot:CAMPEP_0194358216 /NCGR_PEP_ID=MMETSP0174-20130528/5504_1 /TAXON_ID=216777 /ORGANISM="Proboscia alata, Strain PI-D3" /LENGTH=306 /DNA_ID=CAMNT_0039128471 /DNA_START=72 /DNA_END=992 /DNA_ORIENTATION=+
MFSANENIALRQHKRRIVQYFESTIPEDALDKGTSVMVMQVACRAPGCVPLETAVVIVFPKLGEELLKDLPESCGGTFKTKILMPMADVTKEDVLDSLPPQFEGGKKTIESVCLTARDVMLNQVHSLFDEKDADGKELMVQYLKASLDDYVDNDFVLPEIGKAFETKKKVDITGPITNGIAQIDTDINDNSNTASTTAEKNGASILNTSKQPLNNGNFVTKRVLDDDNEKTKEIRKPPTIGNISRSDWKVRKSSNSINLHANIDPSGSSIIQQLANREHAPGIRRPGCPCCDPDDLSNFVDNMIGL